MNIEQHNQTHRFQMFYVLRIFLCLNLLFFSPYALSATFIPNVSELNAARPQSRTIDREAIDELLAKRESAVDYIQIDDMRFKVDSIIQNDGYTGTRWTDGNVYYDFDAAVSATNRQRWLDAAAEWSAVADITFIARTTIDSNYIHVINDPGNWSEVGMVGGQQDMGIFNWTWKFKIAHEIGHALGLSHEQSRSDRDSFVTILWDNIIEDRKPNFSRLTTTNYGDYDFDSVLHYGKDFFTINGNNTIEPVPAYSAWLDLIGQRNHLSSGDRYGMAQRYGSIPPAVSDPDPADGATVSEGSSGQLLRVRAVGATSGTIYYDDDATISFARPAIVNGDYLEATIPYASGEMTNDGTNYWYVEATNSSGTTRYPSGDDLSFTVAPNLNKPVVSDPDPADGATVAEGASGQLLRVTAPEATSGTIYYDDDFGVSFFTSATVNGDYLEATIPYASGEMSNDGTNYWYVEATNSAGTTRYPSGDDLSFTVIPNPNKPVISDPDPADGATVAEGASGQLLRVTASGATSGTIYYDDDFGVSFFTSATVNGDYLEATIPYESGKMSNDGTNYWYVEATNSAGTTRYPSTVYPSSGYLSFTVIPNPNKPVVSDPDPAGGATVAEGASGQLLRVTASGATSGTIYYDDNFGVSFFTSATVNGDYLEATIPYASGKMSNDGTNYWYVEATNSGGTTRYPGSGNLSFTVILTPTPDQYEPDNNSGQANAIQSGASQTHSIVPADDVDWVKLTLTEMSDLTVETNGASGDTRMWLYDGSLTEIAFDDSSGNGLFSRITMTDLAAGTYYVEIDAFGNYDEIPSYTVTADYLSPQDEDILLMILPAIMSAIKQEQ